MYRSQWTVTKPVFSLYCRSQHTLSVQYILMPFCVALPGVPWRNFQGSIMSALLISSSSSCSYVSAVPPAMDWTMDHILWRIGGRVTSHFLKNSSVVRYMYLHVFPLFGFYSFLFPTHLANIELQHVHVWSGLVDDVMWRWEREFIRTHKALLRESNHT